MTAVTNINAIYLGNFASVDQAEGFDWVSELSGNLVNITRTASQMKLVAITNYDSNHDGVMSDDDFLAQENVTYNLGSGLVSAVTDGSLL